ncbi:hypothetical protein F4677DRAFT_180339 [Hypoxylon crocopeplum]|nr:hypothetical protein F4677DRAFT_180339 [Hypoxylon crocopeplum]
MLAFLLLMLPWCGFAFVEQEKYAQLPITHKRQMPNCDQTYGEGSQQCGGAESSYCFNPTIGQSCCPTDNGFCDAGKYCAPVAGYCCQEGEDLATCAQNAGFVLPGSAPNASTTGSPAMADSTTVAGPTVTVVPFQESSVPTAQGVQNGGCSFGNAAVANTTTSVPTFISNANANTNTSTMVPSSLVQVSLAAKRANFLAGAVTILVVYGTLTMIF